MLRPGGRLIYCGVLAAAARRARPASRPPWHAGDLRTRPVHPAELAALPEALTRGRVPAHATRHVARARRHGRLLRRAPDQRPESARCEHLCFAMRGGPCVPTTSACAPCLHARRPMPESPSRPACSRPISRGCARKWRGRGGRRRLAASRRHGRPFRAEHQLRSADPEQPAAAHHAAVRRAPDDRARSIPTSPPSPRPAPTISAVHPEAGPHLHRRCSSSARTARHAGVVLNPATPVESVAWVLDLVDIILVMTVNPGFGGQAIPAVAIAEDRGVAPDDRRRRTARSRCRSMAASRPRPRRA